MASSMPLIRPSLGKRLIDYTSVISAAAVASVIAFSTQCLASENHSIPNCLYGQFAVGGVETTIMPCQADIKNIGSDKNILAIMRILGIPADVVTFQACPGGRLSAMPDPRREQHFLIQYPSELKTDYLAPIAHELAHIFQMRELGSLAALNPRENSRQVELGADFIAGIAFGIALPHLKGANFASSLELTGSYIVEKEDHGLPEERDSSFRAGLTRYGAYAELNPARAWQYWIRNDYANMLP